jgi:hypothetical protein
MLIAPLDVQVTAQALRETVLHGSWHASSSDGGAWDGNNITMVESWLRGASPKVRVRGRASGGPTRVHLVDVGYLKRRMGEGVLTEAQPDGWTTPPVELHCRAQGAELGEPLVTGGVATMQVIDQPARNRVVVRGPGIEFLGPECRPAGRELPVRGVGVLPPDVRRPWRPQGALTSWEFTVPRAEFAAGGTFRFRGRYSLATTIQAFSSSDVFGSGIMHGKVAVDLKVRRIGR